MVMVTSKVWKARGQKPGDHTLPAENFMKAVANTKTPAMNTRAAKRKTKSEGQVRVDADIEEIYASGDDFSDSKNEEATDEDESDEDGEEVNGKRGRKRRRDFKSNYTVLQKRQKRKNDGGKVKAEGRVLKQRDEDFGVQPINMNCRVERFCRKVALLDQRKKDIVVEMGFGGLMHFACTMLPRRLCYWLMTQLDPKTYMLETCDGKKFPLGKNQVNWVFGTPIGPKQLPKVGDVNRLKAVQALKSKYFQLYGRADDNGNETLGISLAKIESVMDRECLTDEDVQEFRTAFLMFAIATILAPTTCPRFPTPELTAVTVANEDCQNYDWSTYVVEHIMHSADVFLKKFYDEGSVSGVGGPVIFLAILYLDRLHRLPVRWGEHPRIKVWTMKEISSASKEDLTESGDYGKLGSIDVAYGEGHPFVARDTPVLTEDSLSVEIAKLLRMNGLGNLTECARGSVKLVGRQTKVLYSDSSHVVRPLRKGPKGVCPYEKRMAKARNMSIEPSSNVNFSNNSMTSKYDDTGNFYENQFSPGPLLDKVESGEVDHGDGSGFGFYGDTLRQLREELKDGCFSNCESESAREEKPNTVEPEARAEANIAPSGRDQGPSSDERTKNCKTDVIGPIGEEKNLLKQRTRKSTSKQTSHRKMTKCDYRNHVSRLNPLQKTLLDFLRGWCSQKRKVALNDCVMISCNGMTATRSNCYSLFHQVDDQYVRTAAVLYNEMWSEKFKGCSSRLMVDPTFAIRVIQEGETSSEIDKQSTILRRNLQLKSKSRIAVLFVPVLFYGHWWCISFDFSKSAIWIIDSLNSNSCEIHCDIINKLVVAVDHLMSSFTGWEKGKLQNYKIDQLSMAKQTDVRSCGVHMLTAIKVLAVLSANYVQHSLLQQGSVIKAREKLLLEDILSRHNQSVEDVHQLLKDPQ